MKSTLDTGSVKGASLRSFTFRQEREAEWRELESLTVRALRFGLQTLSASELERLPLLYRGAVSSLGVARRTSLDQRLVTYLENLCSRGYLAVYASRRKERGLFGRLLFWGFPVRLIQAWPELTVAFFLFLLGLFVSYGLVSADPDWYDAFVPPALAGGRDPSASTETLREVLYSGGESAGALPSFASSLFVHNTTIALYAFSLGFFMGLPTALLLFANGLTLGAFLALYASRGLLLPLLGWLLPHGIPEISAVVIAGAAGLSLGRAFLWPGDFTVREAVRRAGIKAVPLVLGFVLLLAVAGVVEGIFRQMVVIDSVRFGLATFNAAWMLGWIVLGVWYFETQVRSDFLGGLDFKKTITNLLSKKTGSGASGER